MLEEQQEAIISTAVASWALVGEKADDNTEAGHHLDEGADNYKNLSNQKIEPVGKQIKGDTNVTLHGKEIMPLEESTRSREKVKTSPTRCEEPAVGGSAPHSSNHVLGERATGMREQNISMHDGTPQQKSGKARAGQRLKNNLFVLEGTPRQNAGHASVGQPLKSDFIEQLAQIKAMRELSLTVHDGMPQQKNGKAGAGQNLKNDLFVQEGMPQQKAGHASTGNGNNSPTLESTSGKYMYNKEISVVLSFSGTHSLEMEVHPLVRRKRHSDNAASIGKIISLASEEAVEMGENYGISDEDSISINHIQCLHVKLNMPWLEVPLLASFIYAKCTKSERLILWDCLRNLAINIHTPWIVGGDFNAIIHNGERLNGVVPHAGSMEDFATALLDCGLIDGGYEGNP
ncbi:Uncharacterized protein TCM_013313 [Theobroma cacao]|uniref:Uncharacterized protein n=1 Tax=Theobroma cacao TaxID=3641 RepID=A0A061FWA8_THECC|nr:Uncharacterized protein TCM_013313 [Theobroma cacao]